MHAPDPFSLTAANDTNTLALRIRWVSQLAGGEKILDKKVGLSPQTIATWIDDPPPDHALTRSRLILLASAAGVPVSWLTTGIGEPYIPAWIEDDATIDTAFSRTEFIDRFEHAILRAGGVASLAEAIDAPSSLVDLWLAGRMEPTRRYLIAIAHEVPVDLEWLITGFMKPPNDRVASDVAMAVRTGTGL